MESNYTPLEDMSWKDFGHLLNVNSSAYGIPYSIINKVRIVFNNVIQQVLAAVRGAQVVETIGNYTDCAVYNPRTSFI